MGRWQWSPIAQALAAGLLAFVVSLAACWVPSFWLDEGASLAASGRPLPDLFGLLARIDAVHGAYYLLLHGWTAIAGTSELSVRALSALGVGVAAAGTYVLGRQLRLTGGTSLTAAVIFGLLPRVTWMGVEGRSFALATACAVWMTVVFLSAARLGGRRWWGYAALVALGIVLHLYLALLVAVHALVASRLVTTPRARVAWAGATALGVGLSLPVVLTALGQRGQLTETGLSASGLVRRFVVNQWFLGETPGSVDAGRWLVCAVALSLLGWALAGLGAWRLFSGPRDQGRIGGLLLAAWLVVPPALIGLMAVLGSSLYHPRYFGFCAPALALLAAVGATSLRGRVLRAVVALAAIALVMPVYASQRIEYAKSGYDWDAAGAVLAARAKPGDGVLFSPLRPESGEVVRATSRSIASAYPEAFDGLVDVTRRRSAEDDVLLFPSSVQIEVAGERLDALDAVWVVSRADLDPGLRAREQEALARHGLMEGRSWSGPRTTVVEYRRP